MAVPKIRIKDFESEWMSDIIGNISNSFSGGTPTAGNHNYYGGNIPFIRSGEIHSDKTELFLTEEGLNSSSAKLVDKGNILYALYGATSGEVDVSKIGGAINQAILAILPKDNINKYFLCYLLQNKKEHIVNSLIQGGQGNLSGALIKSYLVNFADITEQEAIADYFQSLDLLIEATDKKIATLKQTKQACLQSMFPQEGETKPRVRFKGFTDEWECCKVKDICKHEASNISQNTLGINEGIYPIFGASGYIQNVGFYHQSQEYIGVVKDGSGVGRLGLYPAFSSILGTMHYLLPQKKTNIAFIYNILQTKNLSSLVTGSSIPHIYFKDYAEYEVFVPSLEEQKQIANYFSNLDKQISIQEQRLEKLKQIKSACLKNMFV